MNKDELKGKAEAFKGKTKQAVGHLTGAGRQSSAVDHRHLGTTEAIGPPTGMVDKAR